MITIKKPSNVPRYCEITDSGSTSGGKKLPLVSLSPLGEIINPQIARLKEDFPVLDVITQAIMPDHYHMLAYVKEYSEKELWKMIGSFKAHCTGAARMAGLIGEEESYFEKGFNDLICRKEGQKDVMYDYVVQNPYKYLIRKLYPEYFNQKLRIIIGDCSYALYGNIQLLDHPLKSVVRFSRKFTSRLWDEYVEEWVEVCRQGGVLVSPFIHENEKEVFNSAIQTDARFIRIYTNGFPERFKPYKTEFGLAEEGRLLIIAPEHFDPKRKNPDRELCMQANKLAKAIAELTPGAYGLKRR